MYEEETSQKAEGTTAVRLSAAPPPAAHLNSGSQCPPAPLDLNFEGKPAAGPSLQPAGKQNVRLWLLGTVPCPGHLQGPSRASVCGTTAECVPAEDKGPQAEGAAFN